MAELDKELLRASIVFPPENFLKAAVIVFDLAACVWTDSNAQPQTLLSLQGLSPSKISVIQELTIIVGRILKIRLALQFPNAVLVQCLTLSPQIGEKASPRLPVKIAMMKKEISPISQTIPPAVPNFLVSGAEGSMFNQLQLYGQYLGVFIGRLQETTDHDTLGEGPAGGLVGSRNYKRS